MNTRSNNVVAASAKPSQPIARADTVGCSLTIAQIVLDDSSPMHLYEQLCQALRTAILSGDLPPGTLLPTGRELAAMLKVARGTIVTAYARLVAEGLLRSKRRGGTPRADP